MPGRIDWLLGVGRAGLVEAVALSYQGFRFPVEIISHCVWLYHRFPLSFREVEEMMLERGVVVSHETVRQWCAKFGQTYANGLRRRRPRPGDKWHLDEVFITIQGKTHYLWRAVDQDGNVLDILVTSHRDAKAATRFFRKLLTGLRSVPRVLVTDKLASYGVTHRRLMRGVEHRRSKYLNNRAENSHQPTRARERAMKRFRSAGSRKKTTWWFGWLRGVVRRCHGAEEGGLEPHGKLATDLAWNTHTRSTRPNPKKSTLIFYGSPVVRSGSCPRSAGYHPTSVPDATDSPQPSTAMR